MKTKRISFVAFLLCAIMLLGVGFASITQTLDITGTTEVTLVGATQSFDDDVYFTKAEANQAGNTASIKADNNDGGTFTINTFKGAGDTATFTYTIESVFDQAVTIKVKTVGVSGANSSKFSITTDCPVEGVTLAAGNVTAQTTTITVTVTLNEPPTAANFTAQFGVELEAVAG